MKVRQYRPKDRLFSEQYVIDENGFITIPSTTLFNAGLSSDKEFVVLEKYNANNVYYIVPANFEYNEKEWGFLFNPEVENGDLKFSVKGLFEHLKPGDSVTLDVFEFQLTLYDRSDAMRNNDNEEETGLDAGKIDWTKGFDEIDKYMKSTDPYAPDENMRKNFADKCKRLHNPTDYNDLIENPPSLEELDAMFGNILKEIVNNSNKKLHRSKDPLLNEFIDDMLARVYGKDGQKIVMIHTDELNQFVKDMTYWYMRIKNGK